MLRLNTVYKKRYNASKNLKDTTNVKVKLNYNPRIRPWRRYVDTTNIKVKLNPYSVSTKAYIFKDTTNVKVKRISKFKIYYCITLKIQPMLRLN